MPNGKEYKLGEKIGSLTTAIENLEKTQCKEFKDVKGELEKIDTHTNKNTTDIAVIQTQLEERDKPKEKAKRYFVPAALISSAISLITLILRHYWNS